MGAYFSNLHIRKNNTDPSNLASFITEYFSNKGYVSANPDTADLQIALYAPEESDWMSIFSAAFPGSAVPCRPNTWPAALTALAVSTASASRRDSFCFFSCFIL